MLIHFCTIAFIIIAAALVIFMFMNLDKKEIKDKENTIDMQDKMNDYIFELVEDELKYISQKDLANKLNISQALVSMIASNEHNCRLSTYNKIVKTLEDENI